MTPPSRSLLVALLVAAGLGVGCRLQLQRPETVPARVIEPRLVDPVGAVADAPNATSVRLLETQARGHIGRRLLQQQPGGEVTEDPVWLWTSTPDRYLETALRLAIASTPEVRLVDTSGAPSLAVTVLAWQIESGASQRLIGAVEVQLTRTDRTILSEVIREEEPVGADLPGDLSAAAGRLLGRLAAHCLARVTREARSVIGGLERHESLDARSQRSRLRGASVRTGGPGGRITGAASTPRGR